MKKIITIMAVALFSGIAANAQDDSTKLRKHRDHPRYDTMPMPGDTTGQRKWHKDKKHKDKQRNWPDSTRGTMPDSLRRPE